MAKKKATTLPELMADIHTEIQRFINETAPVAPDDMAQEIAHDLILKLRTTRLKFLNEPDGRKRLRPQIDELGIHIFKILKVLTERGLDHPPKCTQQLREAGLL